MITADVCLKNEKFSKYICPNKVNICIRRTNFLCLLSALANQIYSVIHHFVFQFWIPNFRAENSFLPKSLPFIFFFQSTVSHDLKAIRWKHIACARGIFCSQTSSRVRDMAKHLWIHEKAPCTEVRNWLRVIMHKHLMPWHFLSIPNNHLPLLCLFAINDWVLTPPPK